MSQFQWELGEFEAHARHMDGIATRLQAQVKEAGNLASTHDMYGVVGNIALGQLKDLEQATQGLVDGLYKSVQGSADKIRETKSQNATTEQDAVDRTKDVEKAINEIPKPR